MDDPFQIGRVKCQERLVFLVRSETDSKIEYRVDLSEGNGTCDCTDFQVRRRRTGGICKHIPQAVKWCGMELIKHWRKEEE